MGWYPAEAGVAELGRGAKPPLGLVGVARVGLGAAGPPAMAAERAVGELREPSMLGGT